MGTDGGSLMKGVAAKARSAGVNKAVKHEGGDYEVDYIQREIIQFVMKLSTFNTR